MIEGFCVFFASSTNYTAVDNYQILEHHLEKGEELEEVAADFADNIHNPELAADDNSVVAMMLKDNNNHLVAVVDY